MASNMTHTHFCHRDALLYDMDFNDSICSTPALPVLTFIDITSEITMSVKYDYSLLKFLKI